MATKTLKEQAVIGVFWSFIERFGVFIIQAIVGILLARILEPEDFGILAMIMILFVVASVFIESGFGNAYIQKEDANDIDASTIFYFNLGISLLAYGLLWFSSPFIARYFEQPILLSLTRVFGLVLIINSFSIIQIAKLKKSLNFRTKAKIGLIAVIVSNVIGVYFALTGAGVWSLVYMRISNSLTNTILLWVIIKWIPLRVFSLSSLKSLFGFGGWLLLSSIISQFFSNIYLVVIGKLFPAAVLGYFFQARKYTTMAVQQITGTLGAVSFPVFSKMQDSKERMANGIKQFLNHSVLVTIPVFITLIIIAKPIVVILLTEKWMPMVPYFQLMCVMGLSAPFESVNGQAIIAKGHSKLYFYIVSVASVVRIINIFIMAKYGVLYLIAGEMVVIIISVLLRTYFTKKFFNYGIIRQLNDTKIYIIGGLLMAVIGGILLYFIKNLYVLFALGIILPGGIYLLFQYILNKESFVILLQLKDTFVKKLKRN